MSEIESACGNVYCDAFWDAGRFYRNYSVDCYGCGLEVPLHEAGRHKRTATAARELGWRKGADGKRLCPECLR